MEFPDDSTNNESMPTNSSLMVEFESDEMIGSSTNTRSNHDDDNNNNNNNPWVSNSLVGMYHRVVEKYETMSMHWNAVDQDDAENDTVVTEPLQPQSTTACSASACVVTRSSPEQGVVAPSSSWEEEHGFQEFSPDATCAGVLGGTVGLLLGGIAPSFLCAMGCMVAAKDDDGPLGHWARQCGRVARQTATAPKHAIMARLGYSSDDYGDDDDDTTYGNNDRRKETKQLIGSEAFERDSTGTIWISVQPTTTLETNLDPERFAISLPSDTSSETTKNSTIIFQEQPQSLLTPFPDASTTAWCMPCDSLPVPENTKKQVPTPSPQTASSFTASPFMDRFPRWCLPVGTLPTPDPDLWTTEDLFEVSTPLDTSVEQKRSSSESSSSSSSKYNVRHTMLPLVTQHSLLASSRRNLTNP